MERRKSQLWNWGDVSAIPEVKREIVDLIESGGRERERHHHGKEGSDRYNRISLTSSRGERFLRRTGSIVLKKG